MGSLPGPGSTIYSRSVKGTLGRLSWLCQSTSEGVHPCRFMFCEGHSWEAVMALWRLLGSLVASLLAVIRSCCRRMMRVLFFALMCLVFAAIAYPVGPAMAGPTFTLDV